MWNLRSRAFQLEPTTFGQENGCHLHDRPFVEPPISMIRLLGEEGLVVQGAELAWALPGTDERWVVRAGYGQSREHNHGAAREVRREAYEKALDPASNGTAQPVPLL